MALRVLPDLPVAIGSMRGLAAIGGVDWDAVLEACEFAAPADAAVADPARDGSHRYAAEHVTNLVVAVALRHGIEAAELVCVNDKRVCAADAVAAAALTLHEREPDAVPPDVALCAAVAARLSAPAADFRWWEQNCPDGLPARLYEGATIAHPAAVRLWELHQHGIQVPDGLLARAARQLKVDDWVWLTADSARQIARFAFADPATHQMVWVLASEESPLSDDDLFEIVVAKQSITAQQLYALRRRRTVFLRVAEAVVAGALELQWETVASLGNTNIVQLAADLVPAGVRVDPGVLAKALAAPGMSGTIALTVNRMLRHPNVTDVYALGELGRCLSAITLQPEAWRGVPPELAAQIACCDAAGVKPEVVLHGVLRSSTMYVWEVLKHLDTQRRRVVYWSAATLAAALPGDHEDLACVAELLAGITEAAEMLRFVAAANGAAKIGNTVLAQLICDHLRGAAPHMMCDNHTREYVQEQMVKRFSTTESWRTAFALIADNSEMTVTDILDCAALIG